MKSLRLLLFFVIAVLTCPFLSMSQSLDSFRIATLHFQIQDAGVDALNLQAREAGFPALSDNVTEFGLGIQKRHKQWIYTTSLFVGIGSEEGSWLSSEFTEYRHVNMELEGSWSPISSKSWFIGPFFSVNPQWSRIILRRESEVNSLEDALDTEYQKFTRLGLPTEVGVSVHHFLDIPAANLLLTFGLQGGYRLDNGDNWRVDGAVPWETPGIEVNGWFMAFRIGFRPWE